MHCYHLLQASNRYLSTITILENLIRRQNLGIDRNLVPVLMSGNTIVRFETATFRTYIKRYLHEPLLQSTIKFVDSMLTLFK